MSFAVLRILDWFHIAQKFQNVKNALGEAFATSLERAKWKLWHGNAHDALTKLALLRDNVIDEAQRSKLTGLYDYIQRNQAYIINYHEHHQSNKTYTSQVAESHILGFYQFTQPLVPLSRLYGEPWDFFGSFSARSL